MLKFIGFTLFALFIFAFSDPEHGVYCKSDRFPIGLILMSIFQLIWSPFALYTMRKSELLNANKEGLKEIFNQSKTLALDSKKKENYDEDELK